MVTLGGVVSDGLIPTPVTTREMLSPAAVKVTFAVALATVVGVKRTVTVWVAPAPLSVNGLPDTIAKGATVDTAPEIVPARVLCTVKVRSAKLPTFTLPKLVLPVGLTVNGAWTTAPAATEQALSLPNRSTAVTAT
jgi:hypothetical protein